MVGMLGTGFLFQISELFWEKNLSFFFWKLWYTTFSISFVKRVKENSKRKKKNTG
jgi:hypothetical protein